MTPQNKLYEAAKAVARLRFISHPFVVLREAITAYEQEQPEAIAGEKITYKSALDYLSEMGYGSGTNYTSKGVASLLADFASQQTAHKDQEIADLSGELHATDKLNQELQDEIAELKEAISELIQVKDWKDKYGKDEHYLKAMPIAWENVRKLIQK